MSNPGTPSSAAAEGIAKQPVGRLRAGVLGPLDIAASSMANIAPAMSFYFGFATIAAASGVASPLTIAAAAVAIGLLGHTLSEFSRSSPSAGSFVTFVGRSFGPVMAITTALVVGIGYICGIAAVIAIAGGWAETSLHHYTGVAIPWQLLTAVFTVASLALVASGAKVSTKWASISFAFELTLLVGISAAVLWAHRGSLSAAPFEPSHLDRGFGGLGLGFPLAVYLFVGWENSASLAEESTDPRRNVPRAVFASIALMAALYLFLAYATVVGFSSNVKSLSGAAVPFVTVAKSAFGPAVALAYLAGITSTFGALVAATNSQARILFSAGREGLLPAWVGLVSEKRKTPVAALSVFLILGLGLTYGLGWNLAPVVFFGDVATFGAILISLTYLLANLALPVYYRRHHRASMSPWRHVLLPLLGAVAIGYPLFELVKPGQPAPFNWFPAAAGAVVACSVAYAVALNARDRTLSERIGSIVADER